MKKVRGSQSAFQVGDLVFTKYSSGCLRSILLADNGIRESIDTKHQERGALNEEVYEDGLKRSGVPYDREKPVSEPIGGFDDTNFVGRLDYLLHSTPTDARKIVELKSTESSTVLKAVIKDGKYNHGNLAQLISYMVSERCTKGELIYTYYKPKNKAKVYVKTSERVFEVVITPVGDILVDGEKSGLTVYDQLHHRQMAAKCINDKQVWARPYQAGGYDSPCKYCVFAKVCDWYDAGMIETTEVFIDQARTHLNNSALEKVTK